MRLTANHFTQQFVIDIDNKLLDGPGMKLETYLEQSGGAVALAKALGITPEAIRLWVRGDRLPKPQTAIRIERITDGAVTRADLRPDLFAPQSPQAAE